MATWKFLAFGTGLALLVAVAGAGLRSAPYGGGTPATQIVVSGPPATAPKMVPSFAEDFASPIVDPKHWIFAFYNPDTDQPTIAKRNLWSNKERQVYFDPAFLGLGIQPLTIANSVLRIEARPLDTKALAAVREAVSRQPPKIANSALRDVTHSSGMISTRDRYFQQYGYFEMRARWSAGRGIWPCFWLLPKGGGWPPEIDIVEAHGDKPTAAFQSIHSKVAGDQTKRVQLPAGTGQDFHTYGVMWSAKTIDYYIDGVKTSSQPTPGDMHVPMYMLANLAMGGGWPGDPDASTPNPAYMEIDFIRAWRFADPA